MKRIVLLLGLAFVLTLGVNAQNESSVKVVYTEVDKLPEYVIITSENTKLLGGINIIIDCKKSKYKEELRNLESMLQDGDKLRVRNQTDLLNAMSELGFEYIDGYNSGSSSFGSNDEFSVSDAKFRVNMVFRKKEQFRK